MAFNLKLVLKALLFSSSQPLSIKDIQAAIARFHEKAVHSDAAEIDGEGGAGTVLEKLPLDPPASESVPTEVMPSAPNSVPTTSEQPFVETVLPTEHDADLYREVPSLITATQVREAMTQLAEELRAANDVYLLIEGPTGYRVVTHPRFAGWIRVFRDQPTPVKLSQSALETLAIVAYRQPVTRTEIESIRGVSAEAGLNKLIEREMVYITGRADLPGRPLQYGTTDRFLEFVGVKSLVELPASDVLSPRQIDEWLKNAISTRPPTDMDMGLPLEEGQGETPNLEAVSVEHQPHSPIPAQDDVEPRPTSPLPEDIASSEERTSPPT